MATENELAPDNFMENAAAMAEVEAAEDEKIEEALADDGDIEVPETDFFGDAPASQPSDEDSETEEGHAPQEFGTKHIYKADGQEYEVDFSNPEDIKRALSYMSKGKGADRAFSQLAKLKREMKANSLKPEEKAEYEKLKKVWENLDQYRDDIPALLEIISGKNHDEYLKEQLDRQQRYEVASEEERKLMDMQAQMAKLERAEQKRQAEYERKQAEFERREAETETQNLQNKIVPVFQKFAQFDDVDPQTKKTLQETLWFTGMKKLEQLESEYDISNPKVIEWAFKNVASAISSGAKRSAQAKVNEMVASKKQKAQEQAQVASSRNYPKKDSKMDELVNKDPVQIFQELFRS